MPDILELSQNTGTIFTIAAVLVIILILVYLIGAIRSYMVQKAILSLQKDVRDIKEQMERTHSQTTPVHSDSSRQT